MPVWTGTHAEFTDEHSQNVTYRERTLPGSRCVTIRTCARRGSVTAHPAAAPWPQQRHQPKHHPAFLQATAVSTTKALAGILPAALHQQPQHVPTTTCPRRAGRSPGWLATRTAVTGPGWAGCAIPSTSPEGFHTPSRGQSQTMHAPVPSRVAPGMACGRAAPDRRDATPGPQRARSTAGASDVEKH